MQTRLTIHGVRKFKDTVEGTEYNFTKLVVSMPFPSKNKDSQIGSDALHVEYGDSTNFDKFIGRKFPLVLDGEIEINNKGIEILDIVLPPLNPVSKP